MYTVQGSLGFRFQGLELFAAFSGIAYGSVHAPVLEVDASATPPPALSLDLKMQASGVMGDDFEWSHAEGLVNDLAEITVPPVSANPRSKSAVESRRSHAIMR